MESKQASKGDMNNVRRIEHEIWQLRFSEYMIIDHNIGKMIRH